MRILCTDWFGPGQDASLNCGSFKVDEVEYSGPPTKVSIKAVSAALTDGLRETKKTQAWEGYSLQAVAGEIAQRNGLELLYNADASRSTGRTSARNPTCLPAAAGLLPGGERQVHDGKLVCEAAKRGDARPPPSPSPEPAANSPHRGGRSRKNRKGRPTAAATSSTWTRNQGKCTPIPSASPALTGNGKK